MAPGDYRYPYGSGKSAYRNTPQAIYLSLSGSVMGSATRLKDDDVFESHGAASHSPPPCLLSDATAPMLPLDPPAPILPRRTPRARLAARRQLRPVRSRPGTRRAVA